MFVALTSIARLVLSRARGWPRTVHLFSTISLIALSYCQQIGDQSANKLFTITKLMINVRFIVFSSPERKAHG